MVFVVGECKCEPKCDQGKCEQCKCKACPKSKEEKKSE